MLFPLTSNVTIYLEFEISLTGRTSNDGLPLLELSLVPVKSLCHCERGNKIKSSWVEEDDPKSTLEDIFLGTQPALAGRISTSEDFNKCNSEIGQLGLYEFEVFNIGFLLMISKECLSRWW